MGGQPRYRSTGPDAAALRRSVSRRPSGQRAFSPVCLFWPSALRRSALQGSSLLLLIALLAVVTWPRGAEAYFERAISLPLFVDMTESQQDRVIDCLLEPAGYQAIF